MSEKQGGCGQRVFGRVVVFLVDLVWGCCLRCCSLRVHQIGLFVVWYYEYEYQDNNVLKNTHTLTGGNLKKQKEQGSPESILGPQVTKKCTGNYQAQFVIDHMLHTWYSSTHTPTRCVCFTESKTTRHRIYLHVCMFVCTWYSSTALKCLLIPGMIRQH